MSQRGYDDLFPFQREDVDKLVQQRSRLLGNEMGTGKTPTALVMDQINRKDHRGKRLKTLIVTLSGAMVDAWDDHAMEWTDEDVYVLNPKKRAPFIEAALDVRTSGYFICHWEALRLMPELQKVKWFHIIADECQKMKNRKAQMTRAIKKLPALYRTGVSGTPADNNPTDLWSTLNWLWPQYYRSFWRFYNRHILFEQDPRGFRVITGTKNVDLLYEEMSPWYTHRLKEEVLKELPDKYYTRLFVDLYPSQRKAYNEMRKTMVAWVQAQEAKGVDMEEPLIAQSVVAQLVRLQQFAIGNMVSDGEGSWSMTEPSSKLDTVMEVLEELNGAPLVVFSHFKQPLRLLEERLKKANHPCGLITGDVASTDRGRVVRDFQEGKLSVVASTIKAGGAGITLTRASTVVFIDRDWSPAANKQAEDRLHRIGQTNAVQVIDLIARDTVDIGKLKKVELKWKWVREILGMI